MAEEIYVYTIIKGRVKALASNTFALFYILINNLSKNIEKMHVAASHFSSIYDISPNLPWHEFESKIIGLRWKGEFSINLTNDIQKAIDDELRNRENFEEFYYMINKNNIPRATEWLQNILQRPTGDRNVQVELVLEKITQEEYEEITVKRVTEELKKTEEKTKEKKETVVSYELPPGSVLLETSMVLSPVSGIPIYELKPGDKVMLRITEKTPRGQYFIELLNAITPEGEVKPIPATVEKIIPMGKQITIITNIGPGIYGKAVEEEAVKVKKFEGVIEKQIGIPGFQEKEEMEKLKKGGIGTEWLIILGISIGALAIIAIILIILGIL